MIKCTIGQRGQRMHFPVCTDTGCACYSLKIVFPVLLPVKIPFTLQRTFCEEISGMDEKKGARKRLQPVEKGHLLVAFFSY